MRKILFSVIIPGILALFCGCGPIDYRAEAVEDARAYALKKYPDLSVFQQDFIRFNEPVIMSSLIRKSTTPMFIQNDNRFDRHRGEGLTKPEYDTMQYAFVWDVPGLPGSLVVFAVGERSFRFRDMQRVFLKKYMVREYASPQGAIVYMIRTQPGLTSEQRLLVRFSEPEEYPTTFYLEPKLPEKVDPGQNAWMEYLAKAAEPEKAEEQRSLVWLDKKTGSRLVVVGTGRGAQWTAKKSLILTEKEFVERIDREAMRRESGKQQPKQTVFHAPNPVRADPEE